MPNIELNEQKIRYTVYTKVADIHVKHEGKFIHFEGSWEAIFLGDIHTEVGDVFKITFEKVTSCPPYPTTPPTTS